MVPIAIIHASSPVKACVCLRWGSRAVVVVGPWWSVVVVAGHSVSRVVHWHATWGCLPVDHGCRVASHTCHWTPTIKGKCVWHRGDNCASGGRLYNFLYLKEPKKGGMKWQLIFKTSIGHCANTVSIDSCYRGFCAPRGPIVTGL